jgi:hypothetical protein
MRFLLLLLALASPALAQTGALSGLSAVEPVMAAPTARPQTRPGEEQRCTADGRVCIHEASYAVDLCRAIEEAAEAEGLDAGFFARLLWRESLFDASAVSHAGAQGIAQFMPGTARLRGLQDPFNPAEAILASADYLKDLERRFGNLGMATVAYNAGEQRAARFLAGETGIPRETRAYVAAITGHSGEEWRKAVRDDSPAPTLDLALDPKMPFREACLQKAVARDFPSFAPAAAPEPELLPWGVILAAHGSREAAERQVASLAGLIPGEHIDHVRMRVPGSAQRRHVAQVGRETREAAEALCRQIRVGGAACIVLRN